MNFPSDDELMDGPQADVEPLIANYPEGFRAGFVAIVGRPNVGKSTLTNALVGSKVAITSRRPETTRRSIRGVVQGENYQVVLVDTPGYHRPRTLLGQRLNSMVRDSVGQVDAVLFCLPCDQRVGPGDDFIARQLRGLKVPVIAVATKMDAVTQERVMKHLVAIDKLGDWEQIVPVSAATGEQVDHLKDVVASYLPPSPPLYPLDAESDESDEALIAEYVREAALEEIREELPHSLAVSVEEIIERKKKPGQNYPPMLDVHVNVYVERDSQKAIIIGTGGTRIKRIGMKARREVEKLLGRRIYLDLHVRTAKDWQSDPKMLDRFGF